MKIDFVRSLDFFGYLHTKSIKGYTDFFRTETTVEKYRTKLSARCFVFSALEDDAFDLFGKMDLMVFQNLRGLSRLSLNILWLYDALALRTSRVHRFRWTLYSFQLTSSLFVLALRSNWSLLFI